jgi:hypothetical protein
MVAVMRADRETILLVGDVRLRRILNLLAVPTVLTAASPLETIWAIEQHASTLQMVVVSSAVPWRGELAELLAAEYPEIRSVIVTP